MKKIFALISLCLITFFTQGQGSWTALTSCPGSARYRAVAFEINGKCYMGTGSTGSNNNLKDFWEYDVTMDTWSQKADLTGSKRINATATSANGYGYVGLGVDGTTFMNDWWQYDPTGNSWVSKSSFPGISRYGAGSFSINSRIYAGGGLDSAGNPLSDFYAYDPVNDVWAQKAPLLTGVAAMSIFTINQKGYFVGGVINNFTT